MEPKIKKPGRVLTDLLEQFDVARGVIDYVLFETVDLSGADYKFFKEAVIAALWEIDRRLEKFARKMAPQLEVGIDEFPRISRLDTDRIRGRKISKEEFLGPCYAANENMLITRGGVDPFLNAYFLAGSELKPENILQVETRDEFCVEGYAQAFTEPPYGIDLSPARLDQLFHNIGMELYGGLSDPLEIYEWAGSWCNYFDDGYTGWGAYLWSICNSKNGQFAVIAASTTD